MGTSEIVSGGTDRGQGGEETMKRKQKGKGLEPGCGLRNPRSGLGRVGSMKLGDNLRGMT